MIRSRTARGLVVALTAAACFALPAASQSPDPTPEPGSELRVWLLTAGPGDAVWERYGHNALRVLDTRSGRDVSYNWGIFSFAEPVQFIVRFLQGRMLYTMAPFDTRATIESYRRQNREVVLQELDLTPAEKLQLRNLAEINALPENRDYYYQYFLDNCSTRVRDLLDRVLGGRLSSTFGDVDAGATYRDHTRRLTAIDPLIYTGMDALLGSPTDHDLTVWEEMFLPLTLRDAIRGLEITRADGSRRPLVLHEEVVVPTSRAAEPDAPPAWLARYLIIGLVLGGLFAPLGSATLSERRWLRRGVLTLAVVWSGLVGILGLLLVLLLFTDHSFSTWNENLFLANPLALVLLVALPLLGRAGWADRALRAALACTAIALAGLAWQIAPWSVHSNAIFFALLLPGHLGLSWGLLALRRPGPETPAPARTD